MPILAGSNQRLIKRFRARRKIRRCSQSERGIERIDREHVVVRKWFDAGWRTGPVVFGSRKKVVEDLLAKGASGNSGIGRQSGRRGRDVVHPPVRKRGGRVVEGHDETCGPFGSIDPRKDRKSVV